MGQPGVRRRHHASARIGAGAAAERQARARSDRMHGQKSSLPFCSASHRLVLLLLRQRMTATPRHLPYLCGGHIPAPPPVVGAGRARGGGRRGTISRAQRGRLFSLVSQESARVGRRGGVMMVVRWWCLLPGGVCVCDGEDCGRKMGSLTPAFKFFGLASPQTGGRCKLIAIKSHLHPTLPNLPDGQSPVL